MAVPAVAQEPTRACTAEELAGTRTPVVVEEDSSDGNETSTLATGKPYRASVIPEYGLGDGVRVRDGSVVVTGPPGLALTPRLDDDSGRQVFAFTPQAAGALRLDVSWTAEVGPPGGSGEPCTAAAAIDLTVAAPKLISTTASFTKRRGGYPPKWTLRLVPPPLAGLDARDARDQSPVTVLVRLRTERTPSAEADEARRPTGSRTATTPPTSSRPAARARTTSADEHQPKLERAQRLGPSQTPTCRAAACARVLDRGAQAGQRIGGLRSGGSARLVRYRRSDGAMRTTRVAGDRTSRARP